MSLKFNGTSIVDVILKNAENPNGVNLKHLKFNDTIVWHKNLKSLVTNPTCTTKGFTTYTCSDCLTSYKDNYTDALGHTYDTVLIAPTCTDQGYTLERCSREGCGDEKKSDYVAALGHSWIDATCTTAKTCVRCKIGAGSPLGHAYGAWTTITPATCTTDGSRQRTCGRCSDVDTETLVAPGHQYGKPTTTAPTCTTKGKTTRTCGVCGNIEVTNITPALGHNAGDWIVTKQPTVSSTGKKVKKCGRCNKVIESETIPKLDFIAPALSATVTTKRYDTVKLTIKNNNSFAVSYQVVPSFEGKNRPVHQNLTGTLAANGSVALQLVPADLDGINTTFLRATLLVIFTVNGVSINNETTVYGREGILSTGQNSVSFDGINQYACPILSCYAYNPNDVAVTCYVSIFDNYGSAYETASFKIAARDDAFYEYDCGQSELDGGTYEMYFSADGYADSDTMTGSIS